MQPLDEVGPAGHRVEQHDELVPAEPCHEVLGPDGVAQPPAHLDEHLVDDAVAGVVVDSLEAVEVEEQQSGRRGQHAGREPLAERAQQRRPVGQPGELVAVGPPLEVVLPPLAGVDVGQLHQQRTSAVVLAGAHGQLAPDQAAVRAAEPDLHEVHVEVRAARGGQRDLDLLAVARHHQRGDAAPEHRRTGTGQQAPQRRVEVHHDAVAVEPAHRRRSALEGGAELRLAAGQCRAGAGQGVVGGAQPPLGRPGGRHVGQCHDRADDPAVGVEQRPSVAPHRPRRQAGWSDDDLDVLDRALGERAVQRGAGGRQRRQPVRLEEVEVGGPPAGRHRGVLAGAVQGARGLVEQGQPPGGVAGDDPHRHRVEDAGQELRAVDEPAGPDHGGRPHRTRSAAGQPCAAALVVPHVQVVGTLTSQV
ncbi:MAG TPA: hypothetical protein VM433_09015 [Mycobacteriales bacterium]|nr:hypothetical protein [Mycobacteriales bacterium]